MKIYPFILAIAIISGCGTTTGNYGTTFLVQATPTEALARGLSSWEETTRSLFAPQVFSSKEIPIVASSSYRMATQGGRPLAIRTNTTLTAVNKDGSAGGTLTLSEARLALKEISFEREGQSEAEIEIKYQGPYLIDLMTDTATPSFDTITLDNGTYQKIKMKLAKMESGLPPTDTLYERSIYLEGTYSGATGNSGNVTDIPFTLVFETDDDFELSALSQGFSISATSANTVIVALRMNRWLNFHDAENQEDEDFSDVIVTSGRIDLSKDSASTNHKIWQTMRKLLKASARFGKDSDGSGKLEDNEDDD